MKIAIVHTLAIILLMGCSGKVLGGEPVGHQAGQLMMAGPDVRTVIVMPDGWKAHVWYDWGAHAVLERHVRQITGLQLPVVSAAQMNSVESREKYDVRIWVGQQPEVTRVLGDRLEHLDSDGYVLLARGGDVYLAGKNWWGDIWAVYDLLEHYADCRWYLMEPRWWQTNVDGEFGPGDLLPKAERIELPATLDRVEQPDYRSRWFRIAPMHSFRLRQRDLFHHNLVNIMRPSKMLKSDPDLFPIIDGQPWQPKREYDFQPRVSNPRTVAVVVAAARAFFDANPQAGSFSIGMNDSNRFDNSPETLALAPDSVQGDANKIAWAFWDWCNRIAVEVEKTHPDKRLGCLAYAGLSTLPVGSIKLHPMLVPYLTRDSAQLFDAHEQKEFHETVGLWSSLATRMGIYEYMYGGGFVIPRVYNRYLLPNIKNQYGVGVDGFYAEAYPNWGLDGPKYWLVSKLLWDISADPAALESEFHQRMFGPAAQVMQRYFQLLEETWCTQTLDSTRSNYRWFQDPKQLEIFPPAVCDKAMAFLNEAARLATTDEALQLDTRFAGDWTVAKRVAFFQTSFALTDALSRRYHAGQIANTLNEKEGSSLGEQLTSLEGYLQASKAVSARAEAVRALGFSAYNTTGGNELDKLNVYDLLPGSAAGQVVMTMTDQARAQNPQSTRQEMNHAIDSLVAQTSVQGEMTTQLAQDAKTRGYLVAEPAKIPPVIDGKIEAAWGAPAFDGQFVLVRGGQSHGLLPASRQSEEVTRLWLGHDAQYLYVAAHCFVPPVNIRTTVTENDTTFWRDADMLDDDCLVINLFQPGVSFAQVRVNAQGARSDYIGNNLAVNFTESAVTRTDDGWIVELKLDRKVLQLTTLQKIEGLTFSVARYVHPATAADQKKPPMAQASTLAPYPFASGNIGAGDHPHLMTFRSGSRLLLMPE